MQKQNDRSSNLIDFLEKYVKQNESNEEIFRAPRCSHSYNWLEEIIEGVDNNGSFRYNKDASGKSSERKRSNI